MKKKGLIVVAALLLASFITGTFADGPLSSAVQRVFVTNFPANQNVTVTNPSTIPQTISISVVPYNTTLRAALNYFPFTSPTSSGLTYRYVTINVSQWGSFRAHTFTQLIKPPVVNITNISGPTNPFFEVFGCFRVGAFPANPFFSCAFANFQINAGIACCPFTNSTGTFGRLYVNSNSPNLDQVQGTLIDVYLAYNAAASGLLDSANIGLAIYLKR